MRAPSRLLLGICAWLAAVPAAAESVAPPGAPPRTGEAPAGRLRPTLDLRSRVELADSLVWNAHKMMGVPLPASAVLVRRRGLLHRHFNETADYLFQQDDADLNLGTQSMQCGRRNDALKVWAAIAH